ncbi:hypothetical protein [Pseudoramibacter sp.]|jgi:hypothetical protein|uniref:hypothetical protein n=1 Tax=Pseudoramibacter sp. TaxID=2034862 RepID=UPI0025DC37C6|nr:hypothetical protein [Pseudoramibacter sp.]MCH4072933.1 hypothetical protein [Pseudoramibacter sp.]MCH4106704.1 hypothetical protein [Pseudoramibacter sp.]
MSKLKKKKKKSDHSDHYQAPHQTIKPWHRVGAIILIIALVAGMIMMYGFSYM